MTALTVFLIVVTVLLVLCAAVALVVTIWLGRHVARAGRVAGRGVRAGWSTARAAMPSDAREVRVERARLDRELAVTSNAWESARRRLDRTARRRLGASHEVLTRTGRQLAFEMSLAAVDTDIGRRNAGLPDLRLRVDALVMACGSFRQGLLLATGAYGNAAHVVDTAIAVDLAAVRYERVTGHRDIGVVDAVPVSLSKAPTAR